MIRHITNALRRSGFRKVGERPLRRGKTVIYRRRTWQGKVQHDIFKEVWPDGTIRERHVAQLT